MPLPTLPLPVNIVVGQTGHAGLHNDVNSVANYLLSDVQAQNSVLAAPSAANGAAVFRLLTAADIPTTLAQLLISSANSGAFIAERTSTQTATARSSGAVRHNTSGDMVDGFAAEFDFLIEDSALVSNTVAAVRGVRSGADNSGELHLVAFNAGTAVIVARAFPAGTMGIGSGTPAAKLQIFGSSDIVQQIVKAFSTQTNDVFQVQKNDGTVLFGVSNLGGVTAPTTITAPGTTGNQTINKPAGRVNIAAGGTTITVTNSLVTANSIITAISATNDATGVVKNVVAAAGSFVINIVAATAEVAINWRVLA